MELANGILVTLDPQSANCIHVQWYAYDCEVARASLENADGMWIVADFRSDDLDLDGTERECLSELIQHVAARIFASCNPVF